MPRTEKTALDIERLYREHGAALLLFPAAITGDRSRAQDAVHHVFLKLIQERNLSAITNTKAYLFACTRNAVLNDVRVHNRHTSLDPSSAWFIPPDRDYTAEQTLRRALAALTDDQRQTIILHVWGELTFEEVGDLLGVSANTAASRYRYALAKLRVSILVKENCDAKRG